MFVHLDDKDLPRLQKILIGMAEDIKSVCEEQNVTYMLCGGSALGAARHDGFIPWDDDLDLGILSSDFDRFIKAFEEKFGDKYWIHTENTPELGSTIATIRLKGSVFKGRDDIHTDECGIPIDLFRIENVSDYKLVRKFHGLCCMAMGLFLSCRVFYRNREFLRKISESNPEAKKVFNRKIRIGFCLSFLSVTTWTKLTHKCYHACKNNNSKLVSIPSGRKHFTGEIYKREGLCNTVPHEFDGHTFPVPVDNDGYLRQLYGDYMKIPKPEDREYHVFLDLKFPEET